jgi:dTDP-4-dehydrorhamnose 3,5-epimerase
MDFERLAIPDVVLIRPRVFGDSRGFFMETWQEQKFAAAGIDVRFVQDNHSRSTQHTLRGLHYQAEHVQGKLVRVVTGTVFDVAVDLRRSSKTYGQWVGALLSEENKHALWLPSGFAHGFLVISEAADFTYKCTDFYSPEHERCVRWDDAELKIQWPLPPGTVPKLSVRDQQGMMFRDAPGFP